MGCLHCIKRNRCNSMKKVFCNSIVAKILLILSTCHTITLGPFVFSKKPKNRISQEVVNHECLHAQQWNETAILTGIFLLSAVIVFHIHPAWMFMAGAAYYIWYVVEYLLKLIIYRNKDSAYRNISFEQEAYLNQSDSNYLENRGYFSWIRLIFKKHF